MDEARTRQNLVACSIAALHVESPRPYSVARLRRMRAYANALVSTLDEMLSRHPGEDSPALEDVAREAVTPPLKEDEVPHG